MTDVLRVSLLVRGSDVPAWQARAVERMLARTETEVSVVVQNAEPSGVGHRGVGHVLRRVRENPLWTPVGAALRLGGLPDYLQSRSVASIDGLGDPRTLEVEPSPASDFGNVLPDRAVEAVGDTDVAVRFGFGILKGDVLDAPTHGVLSFHHGDLREYRGQPCGFWEYLFDEDTAGVTLQRLSESLDAGEIVAYEPVDIADAQTWSEVRERLFLASENVLAKGVEHVADDVAPRSPEDLGDLYSLPEGGDVLKYVVKEGKYRVQQVVE